MGEIPKKYRRFFYRCLADGQSNILMQGGRRSGKTFSTIALVGEVCACMPGVRVGVLCSDYNHLQLTMQDFSKVTGETPRGSNIYGYSAEWCGARWVFVHYNEVGKVQGFACDILFVNEASEFDDFNVVLATLPAVTMFAVYNFNPKKNNGLKALINENGSNLLVTTFRDNPYLTPQQLQFFHDIKTRAERPNATKYDQYMFKVYYLGEFFDMVGRVFENVATCSVSEYRNIPAEEVFAIDFGFATDGDPTVLMGVRYWNRRIYCHQYIYEKGLTDDEELARRMVACGINRDTLVFGDYGGNGRERMNQLISGGNGKWEGDLARGFNLANAHKSRTVIEGLQTMLGEEAVIVTETSTAAKFEFDEYELDDHGKPRGADHAIDAVRYAYYYAKNYL